MSGRLIAIGDIHGCASALHKIIGKINPQPSDTIVTLGDYVNRGPDSPDVIDQLIGLSSRCSLIPLLGNHEQILLYRKQTNSQFDQCSNQNSDSKLNLLQPLHFDFLESCRLVYESKNHFFLHANYEAEVPLDQQDPKVVLWLSIKIHRPEQHVSGKTAIVGHSPQKQGKIFDCQHLVCIDTFCYGGGYLTALDVNSREVWQAKEHDLP